MIRTFKLYRKKDISGVSGTGYVAEGVQFEDGTVVMSWLGKLHSLGIFNSINELEKIHGHEGSSYIEWDNTSCMTCGE